MHFLHESAFKQNLIEKRLEKNLTQTDIAEYLNLSTQSISKWETGEAIPSIEYILKLSKLFNCSADDLFLCRKPQNKNLQLSAFGDNLRDLIDNSDYEVSDLAEFLGISTQAIYKWEKGTAFPKLDYILRLTRYFSCSIDDLFNKTAKYNIDKNPEEFFELLKKALTLQKDSETLTTLKNNFSNYLELIKIILIDLQNRTSFTTAFLQRKYSLGWNAASAIRDGLISIGIIKEDEKRYTIISKKEIQKIIDFLS